MGWLGKPGEIVGGGSVGPNIAAEVEETCASDDVRERGGR